MAIGGTLGLGIAFTLQDNFTASAQRISNSMSTLDKKTERASQRISNSMQAVTAGAFTAGASIAGLLLPFGAAVMKSAEFGAQMSDVQAKAQASTQELARLRQQALELSSAQETANFTAKQVGEAQSFLAMAGFNTTQIMEAMRPTLLLASAGSLQLGEAADIASNTLSQFGMRAHEMGRAADVIANAAVNSNQSVRQFADGMKYFGPTAKALGVDLEEAAGAMMLLANAGLQGSLGTRALGTSLAARLTKPTKAAQEVMSQLGFEAFDTAGNFIGLENLVRDLDKSLTGASPKMRQMAIATIFGGEAIQEINTLLTQEIEVIQNGQKVILRGADALAYFTKQNENAAGVAARIARTKLDNLKGEFTILLSTIDTILIKIGAALTPILRPIVATLSSLGSVISLILDTNVGRWTAMAVAGLATLAASAIALNFVINALTVSFVGMASAAITALIPLLPYIAVVGAIAGAVVLVNKGMDSFNELMKGGPEREGFMGFLQKVGGLASGVVQIFKTWNGATFQMSKEMRDALERIGMLDFFLKLSTWVVRTIELFKGLGAGIAFSFKEVGKVLSSIFDALSSVLQVFGVDIDKAFGSMKSWMKVGEGMGALIGGVLIGLIVMLTIKMAALAVSVIAATWPILAIVAAIGAVTYAIANWASITEWFSKHWADFTNYLSVLWDDFVDGVLGLVDKFKGMGASIVSNIMEGVNNALAKIKGMGSSVMKTLLGDELGAKASVALGLETESGTPPITREGEMNTSMVMSNGQRALTSRMAVQSQPQVIIREQRSEKAVSLNAVIELDGEAVGRKLFTEEELQLSRE